MFLSKDHPALLSCQQTDGYPLSTDTSVALIIANTASPSLRFIRFTEPVVMTDVTIPAVVRMTTSETTLSETIFSIVPGSRFRMLVLIFDDTDYGLFFTSQSNRHVFHPYCSCNDPKTGFSVMTLRHWRARGVIQLRRLVPDRDIR